MSFRGTQLKLNADKSIAALPVLLPWDATEIDTEGMWSIANPSKAIIPVGVSLVRIEVQFRGTDITTFGSLFVNVNKNGARLFDGTGAWTYRRSDSTVHGTGTANVARLRSGPVAVVAGDEIELRINSSTAGMANLAQMNQTWMQIQVLDDVWRGCAVKPTSDRDVQNTEDGTIFDAVFQSTEVGMWDAANPMRLTVPAGASKIRLCGQLARGASVPSLTHPTYSREFHRGRPVRDVPG